MPSDGLDYKSQAPNTSKEMTGMKCLLTMLNKPEIDLNYFQISESLRSFGSLEGVRCAASDFGINF